MPRALSISVSSNSVGQSQGYLPHIAAFVRHTTFEGGYDIRTIQELLGHKDVKTTMVDTHVSNRGGKGVKSPVDEL
jgi:site-specific recombinase XerD